ncbi:MAG TPA: galactose-1-phosphate uridylyltransferase, partial [Candidatus Paceibacterota bacterium]|nr:galactose-1-phosphate uridylyltransferase [Candidatus Paceibacterota bacterium]
ATVHCALIHWERDQKVRIVYENERFIVFCPFVSKTPYEMRVFPKEHNARFETMIIEDVIYCAQALNAALRTLYRALGDAPYNFYIHTAPVERDTLIHYDYYHWHIEIVPKIKIDAGFELGTGLSLNPVDPDDAAAKLRAAL